MTQNPQSTTAQAFPTQTTTTGAAPRVMVVDDDLRIHATVGMILGNGGVDFISVLPDKIETQLSSYKPNVILLDLSMPTFDGIAVLGLLRKQRYEGRVIVMSGRDRDLVETARRIGQSHGLRMAAGLHKPFRAAEILSAVRTDDSVTSGDGVDSDIGRAFSVGEIQFHYQPKFDLRSRKIVGFEALARWQHPDRGSLLPAAFLEKISAHGLRYDLARLALMDAAARLEEWHDMGYSPNISINVALDDATNPMFLAQVMKVVSTMSAPTSSLVIELLESYGDLDLSAAAATLTRMRLMGVGISIDDFGVQSSSLARIQNLPANELKVDRSFVANLTKFKQDQIIVRSVVGMARDLGMTVVAEGIEDHDTLKMLMEMGCAYGQGYLLGRPMMHADATQLMKETLEKASKSRSG